MVEQLKVAKINKVSKFLLRENDLGYNPVYSYFSPITYIENVNYLVLGRSFLLCFGILRSLLTR